MKKTINWNELTPACYAIAEEKGCDLGVARSMVQQNIEDGKNTNPGAERLPEEFFPNWASMGGQETLKEDNGGFNAWGRTMQAAYGKLCELWTEMEYKDMVALMDATADPGPIDGIKPGEDVPAPLVGHE